MAVRDCDSFKGVQTREGIGELNRIRCASVTCIVVKDSPGCRPEKKAA